MTAQERYRAMLRDQIAPALRQRGFKGSGTTYLLPDDTHWLQLGFQSSRWNDHEVVRFTVNLSAADKVDWEQLAAARAYPSRPRPGVLYPPEMPTRRLGTLAYGQDHWWQIPEKTDEVAAEVLEAIDRAGLPWLRAKGQEMEENPAS